MNDILKLGVVTPFVIFNFATGSLEPFTIPRYFVSLEHNRTCDKACTFKLNIKYIPDTFSPGEPTLIDNLLVSSVRQTVSYQYGYYDYNGRQHFQNQMYVGYFYNYSSNTNIATGTIDYTIEGTSHVVSLTSSYDIIHGLKYLAKPSIYLKTLLKLGREKGYGGFYEIDKYYEWEHTIDTNDTQVEIKAMKRAPVLDLIMGTSNNITTNKGTTKKVGGLVSLSYAKIADTIEEWYRMGGLTQTQWDAYKRGYTNSYNITEDKLKIPFVCFIDDTYTQKGKLGTLYYIPGNKYQSTKTFVYRYGNNEQYSDVLDFSVSYDGSVPLAVAGSGDFVQSAIDVDGNAIGQSLAISQVNNLSRNTYPTKSGFDESLFRSKKELSEMMLYPFEASMTIIGQLEPSHLLDIIEVVILLNGAEVPVLTGKYQILEINDSLSSQGFHTTFKMRRFVEEEVDSEVENAVATSDSGRAAKNQEKLSSASNNKDEIENEFRIKNN